jgi:hypothetical protein
MENIIEYANQALYWIGAIVTAATVIVRITPSTRDDSVLEKIIHILDYFSVVNPNGTRTLKIVGKKSDNK